MSNTVHLPEQDLDLHTTPEMMDIHSKVYRKLRDAMFIAADGRDIAKMPQVLRDAFSGVMWPYAFGSTADINDYQQLFPEQFKSNQNG